MFSRATKFAAKTPFSTSQVAAAFEQLVSAGVPLKDLEKTMQSLGDLSGGSAEKLAGAISVISQIRGKGKLQTEELMQLAERGLPMGAVLDTLAKKLGKTKDEVQNLLSSGKIKADQGIGAILETIDQLRGGSMEKASNTLAGLWSTLQSVPEDILFSEGAAKSIEKLVVPIKEFIKSLTAALGPDTENGKRLIAMFDQIAVAFGSMFGSVGAKDAASTIAAILNVAEPLLKVFLSFGQGLFEGLSGVLSGIFKSLGSMDPKSIAEMAASLGTFGKVLGQILGVLSAVIGLMLYMQLKFASVIGSIIAWVGKAWDSFKAFFAGLRTELAPVIGVLEQAWGRVATAFAALRTRVAPVIDSITAKLAPLFSALKGLVGPVLEVFAAFALAPIVIVATTVFTVLLGVLETVANAVQFVVAAWDTLVAFFSGLGERLKSMSWAEVGMSIVRGIITGMLAMLGPAAGAMGSLGDAIMSAISGKVGGSVAGPSVGAMKVPSVAVPGVPAAPGGDVMTSSTGIFGKMPDLFGGSPTAASGSPAVPPIQPAAAAGGPTQPPTQNQDRSVHVTVPQILIQVMGGEGGEQAGKQAADSFMGQIGSALKGMLGEAGG